MLETRQDEESKLSHTKEQSTTRRSREPVGAREEVQTRQSINDLIANQTRSKARSAMIAIAEELFSENIPQTMEEAKQSTDVEKWEAAMLDEISSLEKNKT